VHSIWLWQGHTVIKHIRTHTHTEKIHSPTCHQSSFHFKVYLGQQALDGPVGTVDPFAEVLSPDGRSHALSTSRGYDFGNEQPAGSLLQKDWNQFVNLWFFSWFWSHFHIGSSLLRSHFLKGLVTENHYEATEEWRDWLTVYALLVPPLADFGQYHWISFNASPKCAPPKNHAY